MAKEKTTEIEETQEKPAKKAPLKKYNFPKHGVSIEASCLSEAIEKLNTPIIK